MKIQTTHQFIYWWAFNQLTKLQHVNILSEEPWWLQTYMCVCARACAYQSHHYRKRKKKSATNAIKNSKSEKLNEYYHQMLKCSYKNYNIMLLEKTKWIAKLKPQNIHNPAGPHMPEKDSYFTAFSDWKSLACDRTDFRDWEAHGYKQMLPLS